MKWCVAELIVECRVGWARATLWERQLVVLRARSAEAAYTAAQKLGREQNHMYRNAAGDNVRWAFKGLGNLEELLAKTIRSGTEVHSRLFREKAPRVRPKRKLTVFWAQRNLHRKAGALLSEHLYVKRFGRRRPDVVVSIEDRARADADKQARKRERKRRRAADDVQG